MNRRGLVVLQTLLILTGGLLLPTALAQGLSQIDSPLVFISTFLSGLATLLVGIAVKVLFDVRGELSALTGMGKEMAKRLDDTVRRADRHDTLWDTLPVTLKDDRHTFRSELTGQLLDLRDQTALAVSDVALLRQKMELFEKLVDARGQGGKP